MAHKADYDLIVENENNELVLTQYALWKDKRLDIVRYNFTTNKTYIRWGNVDFFNMGGWLVQYPNEKARTYYYGNQVIKLYDMIESKNYPAGLQYGTLLTTWEKVKELINQIHPEFKYLIKKINFNRDTLTIFKLFDLMRMWYTHPVEVETLANKGFYSLALNKSLYRLGKAKKKEIIMAIKDIEDNDDRCTLKLIRDYINSGLTFEEWYSWKSWNGWYYDFDDIETFRYCKRKNFERTRYHDMLSMARQQGHDVEDPYWKYPNNPEAMHERLLLVKNDLEKLAKEEERKKDIKFWDMLEAVKNKNLKNEVDLGNGYILFMPTTYEQYNQAATLLHQCILAGGYYKKVAKGESLLFMIWKDGTPSSTLELDYKGKKLQFYGNELDRNNCKPSEYEQEAITKWLINFKPKKLKEYVRE